MAVEWSESECGASLRRNVKSFASNAIVTEIINWYEKFSRDQVTHEFRFFQCRDRSDEFFASGGRRDRSSRGDFSSLHIRESIFLLRFDFSAFDCCWTDSRLKVAASQESFVSGESLLSLSLSGACVNRRKWGKNLLKIMTQITERFSFSLLVVIIASISNARGDHGENIWNSPQT